MFKLLSVQQVIEYPVCHFFYGAVTHGHLFNADLPPLLKEGDLLFNGHFHTPENRVLENGVHYLNCGSVSLPKEGAPHSYILVDGNTVYFKDLETGGIFDYLEL